ncbi:MAG TPA: hypothetical protein VF420_03135 [Casimicrobiaceae bacterium]
MRTLTAAILLALTANAHAAMYCTDGINEVTWTVGHKLPANWGDLNLDPNAMECGANGQELTYIQRNFQGLPFRTIPTLRSDGVDNTWNYWSGANALFVYENL